MPASSAPTATTSSDALDAKTAQGSPIKPVSGFSGKGPASPAAVRAIADRPVREAARQAQAAGVSSRSHAHPKAAAHRPASWVDADTRTPVQIPASAAQSPLDHPRMRWPMR